MAAREEKPARVEKANYLNLYRSDLHNHQKDHFTVFQIYSSNQLMVFMLICTIENQVSIQLTMRYNLSTRIDLAIPLTQALAGELKQKDYSATNMYLLLPLKMRRRPCLSQKWNV
jgi:hypothetical protein